MNPVQSSTVYAGAEAGCPVNHEITALSCEVDWKVGEHAEVSELRMIDALFSWGTTR